MSARLVKVSDELATLAAAVKEPAPGDEPYRARVAGDPRSADRDGGRNP